MIAPGTHVILIGHPHKHKARVMKAIQMSVNGKTYDLTRSATDGKSNAQTIWSWLEASGVAVAMREWTWAYPIVEITHIIGFVVLVSILHVRFTIARGLALVVTSRPCSSFITRVSAEPALSTPNWIPNVHDERDQTRRESGIPA